jgi:GWxTD domain-containing protein
MRPVLFISILLIYGCVTINNSPLDKKDLYKYSDTFNLDYQVRHENKSSYLLIKCQFDAIRISFSTFNNKDSKDKIYEYERDFKNSLNKTYKIRIDSFRPQYILELKIYDLNNYNFLSDIIYVDRTVENKQTIYIASAEANRPVLKNYVKPNQEFRIEHYLEETAYFFIKYYSKKQPAASPVFVSAANTFAYKEYDAIYHTPRGKGIKLTEEGLYFVQVDSNSTEGVFLNCFGDNFPNYTNEKDLINSLAYIIKKDDHESLCKASNPKKELYKFWDSRRKNYLKNRPRTQKSLISIYYSRIRNANILFTTNKEGWKTDRGMLYIIFGQPDNIRQQNKHEIWFYHPNHGRNQMELIFDKRGERYELERSSQLRQPWRAEINNWEEGIIN